MVRLAGKVPAKMQSKMKPPPKDRAAHKLGGGSREDLCWIDGENANS